MRPALFAMCLALTGCGTGALSRVPPPTTGATATLARARPDAIGATMPAYSIVYTFEASPDANAPTAGLIAFKNQLYGASFAGGTNGYGTVFSVEPSGSESVVYRFAGPPYDGDVPQAGLVELGGRFYGTTIDGGTNGAGTVFSLTPSGGEQVIYSFGGGEFGPDGSNPEAGLIAVNGVLYGTTANGGTAGQGTVFSITTKGTEKVVHSFGGAPHDGAFPVAGLIDVNGTLYGTTASGGACSGNHGGCGTVFSLSLTGSERVIHVFHGGRDGAYPYAGLLALDGQLYGTTQDGGDATCECGTVFRVSPAGQELVLHRFTGGADGVNPQSNLIYYGGTFYGTTVLGGGHGEKGLGSGTVFALTAKGNHETVLHAFDTVKGDGALPAGPLVHVGGALYGLTVYGGDPTACQNGCGTVFALTP